MPVNPSQYFYRRQFHDVLGYYDVTEDCVMDVDFLLRVYAIARILYVDETSGNFRLIQGTRTYRDAAAARSSPQALEREEIELGQLEPMRDFCFCSDGVRGHLTVAAHGIPGDVYVYGQGRNISMRDWASLILRIGEEEGYWQGREVVSIPERFRPGVSEVMALRVGYEKLKRESGWEPRVSWEEGISRTIAWYAANRERWIGRVDWLQPEREPAR